ncbi:MAG: hypothetical protein R2764_12385 [Bacteroidales bacterium]
MLVLTDSQVSHWPAVKLFQENIMMRIDFEEFVENMFESLRSSNIRTDWLFLNADAGFDIESFRAFCYRNDIIDIDKNKKKR